MCCNFLHFAGIQSVVSICFLSSVGRILRSVLEVYSLEGDEVELEATAII